MTREDVLKMEAGPELDASVEWNIFNNKWIKYDYVVINGVKTEKETWLGVHGNPDSPPAGTYAGQKPPERSRDISAAIECLEKLNRRYILRKLADDHYLVTIFAKNPFGKTEPEAVAAKAETLALAICRTLLLTTIAG